MHLFNSTAKIYMTDHLGSVLNAYTGSNAKNVYGSFGEDEDQFNKDSPVSYRHAGRDYESSVDLYYNRSRYYSPSLRIFLTKDPLQPFEGGDVNSYRYVRNNPINAVDPMGLKVGDWWDLPANIARAREIAQEEINRRPMDHNDLGDAMRHAEWNRRMVTEINYSTAWLAGTGHEIQGAFETKLPMSQYLTESLMDLHNNAVGREAGANGISVNQGNLWILPLNSSQYNQYSNTCGGR